MSPDEQTNEVAVATDEGDEAPKASKGASKSGSAKASTNKPKKPKKPAVNKASEKERRDEAQAHKGEVVEDSGVALELVALTPQEHMTNQMVDGANALEAKKKAQRAAR